MKRLLLIGGLLFIAATQAPSYYFSVALVSNALQHAVNDPSTSAIDTTGASGLFACVASYTGGPADSFSDSKSNTWTALTSYSNTAGFARTTLYYVQNPTVGTSHTFTNSGTGVYSTIAVAAFSGLDTAALYNSDVTGINDFNTSAQGPMQPGSVTVGAGDLAITCETTPYAALTTTWTIDSGFSITDQYHVTVDVEGGGLGYFINSGGSTSKNPNWGPSQTVTSGAASIATFNTASAASAPPPRRSITIE